LLQRGVREAAACGWQIKLIFARHYITIARRSIHLLFVRTVKNYNFASLTCAIILRGSILRWPSCYPAFCWNYALALYCMKDGRKLIGSVVPSDENHTRQADL
jgi:hypothetical protein